MIKKLRKKLLFTLLFLVLYLSVFVSNVFAWSNGGYSADPSNPDYGTHDWIAQHSLDWLPSNEKEYIENNLATYLYGTELPDNSEASDGIGDTTNHHIYYASDGTLQDDSSADRALEEYNIALNYLNSDDFVNAAKHTGIMTHYIADIAVFGHVMGAPTTWGSEQHHSDYESYVNSRTNSYEDDFNIYLSYDGSLDEVTAYDAAVNMAYDTTFDVDGDLTCVWMDQNYDWNNPTFRDRCGESLNLAVNYLSDVLHSLYINSDFNNSNELNPNNPNGHVMINEVELNPPGNDNYGDIEEWVELYNPTASSVDMSSWKLTTTHGAETVTITIPPGTIIQANGYYVYGRGSQWLDNNDESVILQNSGGTEIDRTPTQSDNENDSRSWQRYPNGLDTNSASDWQFRGSTEGASNGGEAPPTNGDGTPQDTTPPTISNAMINPNSGYAGTLFTIRSDVSDPSGVKSVVAHIQKPDEINIVTVPLTDPESDGTYTGTWNSISATIGTHWIDIVATDTFNNIGEENNAITFTIIQEAIEEPPEASFTYSPTTDLSILVTITFEDTSIDNDGTIVSWLWDFGDSSTSNDQNPSHKYGDKGIYIVQLTITDNDGYLDTTMLSLSILNLPPTADFTYSPESPKIKQDLSFTEQSEDPEGKIFSYLWDFDDGSTSTERNPNHSYVESGTYTVKLTVTDDEDATDMYSDTITVIKISSSLTCSVSKSEVTGGESVTVSGTIDPALSDKTVLLSYKKPDDSSLTRTVTTGPDGLYSDSYTPDADGSWSITASWDGDSMYEGASSSEVEFTVNTSLIGGPGWADDIAIIGVIGIIIVILLIVIFRRSQVRRGSKF